MAKVLVGTVTSDKPNKTIIVTIRARKTHPLYRKQYTVSRKFAAHDETNQAKLGDKVSIIESRPLSARKRYMLKEILERPAIREDQVVEGAVDQGDKA